MRTVLFFNVGTAHVPRLLVATQSLRRVGGFDRIVILDPDPSPIVRAIAQGCGGTVSGVEFQKRRMHSAYVAKAGLWRHPLFDARDNVLQIDSDVLFARNVAPLFETVDERLTVTQFGHWNTQGKTIRGRVLQWEKLYPGLVAAALQTPHPAINTGVVGWRRGRDVDLLEEWNALSIHGWRRSFTDELAMQLLLVRDRLGRSQRMTVVDDSWNASPVYKEAKEKDVRIWHFHGGKHTNDAKGGAVWWSVFREAYAANIADVQLWARNFDPRIDERLRFQAAA